MLMNTFLKGTAPFAVADTVNLEHLFLWICGILAIAVLGLMIYSVLLILKVRDHRNAKKQAAKEAEENSDNQGTKVFSFAAVLLLLAFPVHFLLLALFLAAECGLLIFAVIALNKELKKVDEEAAAEPEPEPESEPEPEPEPEPEAESEDEIEDEIVVVHAAPTVEEEELVASLVHEAITIEEAHEAITDEMAIHFVDVEKTNHSVRYQSKWVINVDTLSDNFSAGDTVNLETLKEKALVPKNCDYVKVLARGEIDKSLTVEAHDFSADAIKMIILTGGHAAKKI